MHRTLLVVVLLYLFGIIPSFADQMTFYLEKDNIRVPAITTDEITNNPSTWKKKRRENADSFCQSRGYERARVFLACRPKKLTSTGKSKRFVSQVKARYSGRSRALHFSKITCTREKEKERDSPHTICSRTESFRTVRRLATQILSVSHRGIPVESQNTELDDTLADLVTGAISDFTNSKKFAQAELSEEESVREGLRDYFRDRRDRNVPLDAQTVAKMTGIDTFVPGLDEQFKSSAEAKKAYQSFKGKKEKRKIKISPSRIEGEEQPGVAGVKGATGAQVVRLKNKKGKVIFVKSEGRDKKQQTKSAIATVSAYQMSKTLGLDLVPPARIVKYQGKIASSQEGVPSGFKQGSGSNKQAAAFAKDWAQTKDAQDGLGDLRAFDYLIGAVDRHTGNLFFDTEKNRIKGIDYQGSFEPTVPMSIPFMYPLSGGILPENYSDRFVRRIKRLTFDKLEKSLPLLTNEQLEGVWMRVHILKADILRKSSSFCKN